MHRTKKIENKPINPIFEMAQKSARTPRPMDTPNDTMENAPQHLC